jgi:putative transposase
VIPFFVFPLEVRRVVYTANAIESVHSRLRKIIKTRGHFPSDDAASKLIWLALRNITANWSRAAREWKLAMNQFAILFEERFTPAAHGAGCAQERVIRSESHLCGSESTKL